MSRSSCIASSLFAATLVACGGAAADSAPKAPSSIQPRESTAEPETVEQAQAELERARAALTGTGAGAGSAPSAAATPQTSPSTGTSQPAPSPAAPQAPPQAGGALAATACDQICRAVSSMHRAKDAICRLAGPSDSRCADAQKKVVDGDAQAASCSCPR